MSKQSKIQKSPLNSNSQPIRRSIFKTRGFSPQTAENESTSTTGGANVDYGKVDFSPRALLQPKLTVGAPGDKYEQEADNIATQVKLLEEQPQRSVEPIPELFGDSKPSKVIVFGNTLNLKGKTEAIFNGSWEPSNEKISSGKNCKECDLSNCVNASGTLVNTFTVSTEVLLPQVSNDLTPCQQKRVQKAINTILMPHEQKHVKAFQTFNGTSKKAYNYKNICRDNVKSKLQAMHDMERESRQAAAQAKSDALDPFYVPVDLDCKD